MAIPVRLVPALLATLLAATAQPSSARAPRVETGPGPLLLSAVDEFRHAMLDWDAPAPVSAKVVADRPLRLAAPLDHMRPSSYFGFRTDPIDGQLRYHAGIDIPDEAGAPIHAAADGVVLRSGWAGGYGNLVSIRHADGLETRYGHLSRVLVQAGQFVRQGMVIGLVGQTGRATGNHLHFEVRDLGRAVDPQIPFGRSLTETEAVHVSDDVPVPVVAHWTGWESDSERLPRPAF